MQAEFHFEQELAFAPGASLAEVPAAPGVFALFGHAENDQPYLSRTPNLRRRLQRLLTPDATASRRLELSSRVARISYSLTGSDFAATLLLYRATASLLGLDAAEDRLRLRTPFCIRLAVENPYPRAYVTNKISTRALQHTFGPFPTRAAAERFLDESLNLFKLRRCDFELAPDPAFPGCVYSEMKMCLAPCFKGCTDERYAEESTAVGNYLATRGESLFKILSTARDAASEALDFERAAELHAAITRAQTAAHLADEIVRPLDQLNAILLQPASTNSAEIFLLRSGLLSGPATISADTDLAAAIESLEHQHAALTQKKFPARLLTSHLALLKRWYYRGEKNRTGDIFFSAAENTFPIKRITRAISRLLTPETVTQPDAPVTEPAATTDTLTLE